MLPDLVQLKREALADCNAGHYAEALPKLCQLLDFLKARGTPSTEVMYWKLVAQYQGDRKRAMDEFAMLDD